jgi:hypothetical protein
MMCGSQIVLRDLVLGNMGAGMFAGLHSNHDVFLPHDL